MIIKGIEINTSEFDTPDLIKELKERIEDKNIIYNAVYQLEQEAGKDMMLKKLDDILKWLKK